MEFERHHELLTPSQRKIKCSGGQLPCATCLRRGHSQSCFYKRGADTTLCSTSNESELLHRIRNLENLLKQQIAQSSQNLTGSRLGSTPTGSPTALSYAESEAQSVRLKAKQSGTITTSSAGYQVFSSRASVLHASSVHEQMDSVPSPLGETNFPFTSDPISARSILLDSLPPLRQCDDLKCIFFEVFSPVSQEELLQR